MIDGGWSLRREEAMEPVPGRGLASGQGGGRKASVDAEEWWVSVFHGSREAVMGVITPGIRMKHLLF